MTKIIDENYFKMTDGMQANRIEDILDEDESVLLRTKPKKKAYIFNSFFKMFPIAFIWLIFDGGFLAGMIYGMVKGAIPIAILAFIIPFFALHLIPVWMWIGGIVKASAGWKNIEYVFTEKGIILRSGLVGIDFVNIYYSDILGVNLKVGFIDRIFKVGDIYISANNQSDVLWDIPNPYFILKKIQNIVVDIKTDIIFPNDLRPGENHGFRTKYRGRDYE